MGSFYLYRTYFLYHTILQYGHIEELATMPVSLAKKNGNGEIDGQYQGRRTSIDHLTFWSKSDEFGSSPVTTVAHAPIPSLTAVRTQQKTAIYRFPENLRTRLAKAQAEKMDLIVSPKMPRLIRTCTMAETRDDKMTRCCQADWHRGQLFDMSIIAVFVMI